MTAELIETQKPSFIVYTLGQFDVIKDHASLVKASSGAKKIWELYKFMLTHRKRSYTPETLMDDLWVSEEYNDPRSTLRRQMHRLRQALDEENVKDSEKTLIFSNGYYSWNDTISLKIDADVFEELVKKGDDLKHDAPQEALEAYQQALELYKGDYLPECIDQHWVFAIRNYYRRLFLKAVIHTIELLKVNESYDEILRICQKAIQIDVYEEVFHINMVDALLQKGEQRQAIEHYEYITSFFYKEMGIQASPEMKAVYKRVLHTKAFIQSEENLSEALQTSSDLDNAFYCESDVFKSIYELERRRSERSGASFSIGVLTIKPIIGYTHAQQEIQMTKIKTKLMEQLRKGDTLTRWNDQQFFVLLPGVDIALTKQVLQRVLKDEIKTMSIVINQINQLKVATQPYQLV